MATLFYLVRHAVHPRFGQILVGRAAGARLNALGHRQARHLGERLKEERLTLVQSSPRERARATALPIARNAALPLELACALDEIDMGEWTGRSFRELDADPRWRRWNTARGRARPPGGESMLELQRRILRHLRRLRSDHRDGRIVLVSHAEPIRAALLHFLEMPLDEFARIEVGPASISMVALNGRGGSVLSLNKTNAR